MRVARHYWATEEALTLCAAEPLVWVIGGGEVYTQAAPLADVAEVTEIHHDVEGDVHAPVLGPGWRESRREPRRSPGGLDYSFVTYVRG